MTKSQGLVLQSDSHKKKKLKLNVEEITYVQDEKKEEMNGKKKRKAEDEVCGYNSTLSFDLITNVIDMIVKINVKSLLCI